MITDEQIEQIISELEYHNSRNMGQVTLSVNDVPVKIQKRSTNNYVLYFFENKKTMDQLDIKLATDFKKFTKDQLISFFKGE